ncbi:hypothetical protein L484_008493 [Morus notabilis]|uniref:Uncharacterized protein n=1 Tax=Morus notabilis TaxID=981085 RepID=W9S750_9ROSA|nr:hypothetical protein L484_008493 [Morus notabilis]
MSNEDNEMQQRDRETGEGLFAVTGDVDKIVRGLEDANMQRRSDVVGLDELVDDFLKERKMKELNEVVARCKATMPMKVLKDGADYP